MAARHLVKYIEHKSECHTDKDDAWIARVWPSASMKTLYFRDMALKRHVGADSNHYDLVSGEFYWVSGVKKRGSNRHWAATGRPAIYIEECLVEWYYSYCTSYDWCPIIPVPDFDVPNIAALRLLEHEKAEE